MTEHDLHVDGEGSCIVSLAEARRLVSGIARTNTWALIEVPPGSGAGRFICEGRGPDLTPLAGLQNA